MVNVSSIADVGPARRTVFDRRATSPPQPARTPLRLGGARPGTADPGRARGCGTPLEPLILSPLEFLNFLIILAAGWLVWRRPERERLAFALLVVSFLLMALVFLIGTHTSLVPGVNL